MGIKRDLQNFVTQSLYRRYGEISKEWQVSVRKSTFPAYDYQTDCAFIISKSLKITPLEIFRVISSDYIEYNEFILTFSDPGFINICLTHDYLTQEINQFTLPCDVVRPNLYHRVVIDYSSANLAKEMHVGHLRSTIIGDALARILDYAGYEVIRQNHLGDWGMQFGFLIQYLIENLYNITTLTLTQLNQAYQKSKEYFDTNPDFEIRSRERLYLLQNHDSETFAIWAKLFNLTKEHLNDVFSRLDVLLTDEDIYGESYYAPMLTETVQTLEKEGLCEDNQGAKVVFLEGFVDKDKNPFPMIIQKSDGTYLYATTDIAALWYRLNTLKADWVIYVTDARQRQHFSMLFALADKAGWEPGKLSHVAFGSVLGADKKPFKTRSGEMISLISLLEEAEKRAIGILENRPEMSDIDTKEIGRSVGIGALKYCDLRNDLVKDYVFDWEAMLAFEGNTATYIQNAFVRIQSIFRKANVVRNDLTYPIVLTHEYEKKLALHILEFPDVIESVCQALKPHYLCTYLFDLCATFHEFYEHCRVLNLPDQDLSCSRLSLLLKVSQVLDKGLDLLGIKSIYKM